MPETTPTNSTSVAHAEGSLIDRLRFVADTHPFALEAQTVREAIAVLAALQSLPSPAPDFAAGVKAAASAAASIQADLLVRQEYLARDLQTPKRRLEAIRASINTADKIERAILALTPATDDRTSDAMREAKLRDAMRLVLFWFDRQSIEAIRARPAEMDKALRTFRKTLAGGPAPDPDALTGCADDQTFADVPVQTVRAAAQGLR